MESSKRPLGLLKGRYIDSGSQRNRLRLPDLESLVEYEDRLEAGLRYTGSVKAPRTDEGERTLSRGMGKRIRKGKD